MIRYYCELIKSNGRAAQLAQQCVCTSCLFRRLEDEAHMPNTNRTPQYCYYPMRQAPIHISDHPLKKKDIPVILTGTENRNQLTMYMLISIS